MNPELAGVEKPAIDNTRLVLRRRTVVPEAHRPPALVTVDVLGRTSGLLDVLGSPAKQVGQLLGGHSLFHMRDDIADLGRIELVAGAVIFEFAAQGRELGLQALDFLGQQSVLFGLVPASLSPDLVQHAQGDKKNQIAVVWTEVDLVKDRIDKLTILVADLRAAPDGQFASLLRRDPSHGFNFGQADAVLFDDLQNAHGSPPMVTDPRPAANQGQTSVNGTLAPEQFTIRKRESALRPPSNQVHNIAGKGHPHVPEGAIIGSFHRYLDGTYLFTTVTPEGFYKPGPAGLRWPDVCKAMDAAAEAYGSAQKRLAKAVGKRRPKPQT